MRPPGGGIGIGIGGGISIGRPPSIEVTPGESIDATFLAASVKLYIADRSYSVTKNPYKTLPYNDFQKIHDWAPTGSGGSGTIIHVENGEALVITCKHVVSQPSAITVTNTSRQSVRGEFLLADRHADLAMIVIAANSQTPYVPVAPNRLPVGTVVQQAGYPGGQGPIKRVAKVFAYTNVQPYNLRVSFASRPGDSGSGLYDPLQKGLCGVVWGGDGREAVCVEQYDVKRFLDTCLPIFRKRPRNPGGPPQPPVDPGVPPQPPVAPETKPGVLDAFAKKLKELEDSLATKGEAKTVEDVKNGLEKAKSILGLLENGLTDLRNAGLISQEKYDGLHKKLEGVTGVIDKIDDKVDSKLSPILGLAKDGLDLARLAKGNADTAAIIAESAGGWGKYLPWIIPGAISGPIGIGLAGLALYRRIGRKAGADGLLVTDDIAKTIISGIGGLLGRHNTQPAQVVVPGTQAPVVVSQSPQPMMYTQMPSHDPVVVTQPPIVPQVRTEHQVVRIPDTTGEEALRKAIKIASENGIINPGALGPIDNLARQILSGNSK